MEAVVSEPGVARHRLGSDRRAVGPRGRTGADYEMQMWARRGPGTTREADQLALTDRLAIADAKRVQVRVQRDDSATVVDPDQVPVAAALRCWNLMRGPCRSRRYLAVRRKVEVDRVVVLQGVVVAAPVGVAAVLIVLLTGRPRELKRRHRGRQTVNTRARGEGSPRDSESRRNGERKNDRPTGEVLSAGPHLHRDSILACRLDWHKRSGRSSIFCPSATPNAFFVPAIKPTKKPGHKPRKEMTTFKQGKSPAADCGGHDRPR